MIVNQTRKPVKTPARSPWYKGKYLDRLHSDYKKTALVIRLMIDTGIRTSELPYVTVEAVTQGLINVKFIQKTRTINLSSDMQRQLSQYASEYGIVSGPIFLTLKGYPCGRNAMFHAFGKLAAAAGIAPERLTSDALRKYYHDKHTTKNNLATVQSSLGYRTVNYYVEQTLQDDETLLEKLDDLYD